MKWSQVCVSVCHETLVAQSPENTGNSKVRLCSVRAIALMFGVYCLAANAVNWELVGGSETARAYVDTDSIKREGSIVHYWDRSEYSSPRPYPGKHYVSARYKVEVNCDKQTLLITHWVAYEEAGNVVATETNDPSAKPNEVAPGSTGAKEVDFVCGYSKPAGPSM